jgi:hypothetical protein
MTTEVTLPEKVLETVRQLPEGTPITPKELLHLGSRPAVDQALSRLTRSGKLLRPGRGIYVAPIEGRFGTRPPAPPAFVRALAKRQCQSVATSGPTAANALGLTTQVPVRETYLTSGPNLRLQLGRQTVYLRHAPRWQLLNPGRLSGEIVRALAWLGPEGAPNALSVLGSALPEGEREALSEARALVPSWMAENISKLVANAY